jgi:CheY-like chemotaxis protein
MGAFKKEFILPWQQELPTGKNTSLGFVPEDSAPLGLSKKNSVLLIDDSMRSITALNQIFSNLGCETLLSFDGYTALNTMMMKEVDLMILDMRMPDMSGEETLLRADELIQQMKMQNAEDFHWHRKIPVVIYTALEGEAFAPQGVENFDLIDIWHKPISYSSLSVKAQDLVTRVKI